MYLESDQCSVWSNAEYEYETIIPNPDSMKCEIQ